MSKMGRLKRRRFYILIFMIFGLFIIYMYSLDYSFLEAPKELHDENNYLEMKGSKSVLVNLPGCVIPLEVESLTIPKGHSEVCDISRPSLTFVHGNKLIINSTFKGVSCCYKGIQRIFGSDDKTVVSPVCTKFKNFVEIQDEDAVVVVCEYGNKIYDDYHAIVRKKSVRSNTENVPNIVIIGLDSVSRFHFHKLMPKTKQVLEQLGSIELLGYTKVGENTFPNVIALLTGYEEDQVLKFCYNRSKPIDSCPFIWNRLRMTTAFLEDAPRLAIFNYFKFGFLNPPTAHYLRPLMLTAATDYYPYKNMFPCVGSRSTESFVLDHIGQLLSIESPLFLFSWLTTLAHQNADNLPDADLLFSNFFQKTNLNNTIVIFMSDHGHRFGDGRTTFNGWFNEKLPYFTITIPPKVKSFLGDRRMATLESNVNKLTSPFDVYHTLMEILMAYKVKDVDNSSVLVNNKHFPRTQGQSLFTSIPVERTCSGAGIPKDFCACSDLQGIDMKDPFVESTIRGAIAKINSWIPKRCRQLSLAQITAAAKLNDAEIVVGFTTRPGGFRFETIFDRAKNKIGRISRVNGLSGVWCVNDWFFELYCYCDLFGLITEYVWS